MTHPLVQRALADVGLRETAPNVVPGISDGSAWCALALVRWLNDCGIPIPRIAGARDVMIWLARHGYGIDHRGELQPGDVLFWPRTNRAGEVVGGHVSVLVEVRGKGRLSVVAGNSGPRADRVARSVQARGRVTGAARVIGG